MFVLHNWPVALVFLIMSVFSFIWRYFDSTSVLSEFGTLSNVKDNDMDHSKKYVFSTIGKDVINNQGRCLFDYIVMLTGAFHC